jgi:hypothetical protein
VLFAERVAPENLIAKRMRMERIGRSSHVALAFILLRLTQRRWRAQNRNDLTPDLRSPVRGTSVRWGGVEFHSSLPAGTVFQLMENAP